MSYSFAIENGAENYTEIEPLYKRHYGEMQARLAAQGIVTAPFNPRLHIYMEYWNEGHLVNYIARKDGEPVGYCNVYLTNDMHNREKIAREDALYMLPEHRNGTGKQLVKFVLNDLRSRGVKRAHVSAVTDLRVAKLWQRMGFKPVATEMTYTF